MKVGIVGLPNVGKSTLFKVLTRNPVDINNYPFCTIDPNIGIVKVPDERLWKLSQMSQSKKTVPAVVEFVDIAGLVKGASQGEGLGNAFLANIREVDAIVHVVRVFGDGRIIHVDGSVNPHRDRDTISTELMLADLQTIQKHVDRLSKESKSGDKDALKAFSASKKIRETLDEGNLAIHTKLPDEEMSYMRQFGLLTAKPMIYVFNVGNVEEALSDELENLEHIKLDIKMEEEILDMTDEERKELEVKTNLDQLIRKAYDVLGLITFLTTGEQESRAWTIKRNSTAPEAGAAIHTDFMNRFIRAEVISWNTLLSLGSWNRAREEGKLRTEGKNYIVCDGDVIVFKV
ncbi:MAG: redox-regulated ATPase YchF [Candidatus Moraniibacteriota bacterium]|nr:MAG: redox-regulated ATPase YchF [Candidatus Moranbacteria bacterium]